jgi:ribose transport system ATP-binding protein
MSMSPPLLQMQNVTKRFGPTLALDSVSLTVEAGQVLALIGENGAGKSTLLKILSGAYRADSGQIRLLGQSYLPTGNPHQARRAGIAMIYQELNLAPDLSVEDNIMLGQPCATGGLLLRARHRAVVSQALETVGLGGLALTTPVHKLSLPQQQLVEIARALTSKARVILFDEPTSSLPRAEVARLFEIIRQLKSQGLGIIYISHFLEEIREIADRYTVLRDGQHVGEGQVADVTDQQIITLMVGRDVKELYPQVPHQTGEVVLSTRSLCGSRYPRKVDLELHRGEIFGLAGLVGSGRTELVRTIAGLDYQRAGTVHYAGREIGASIPARMQAGLGFLSEDRKLEGLAQDLSITENITLSRLKAYSRGGILNLRIRDRAAEQLMQTMQVKAHSAAQPVSQLSGGNQQKVALARILHQQSDVLLLDEPTKGIDVGTKSEIYRMMGQLAAEGKTIVFVSSYLPELLAVCDRIGVMSRGVLAEIRNTPQWTDQEIMSCAVAADIDHAVSS